MSLSGAVLREVGTTNKTHLHDYKNAINEKTALILKVHQSNYRISRFHGRCAILPKSLKKSSRRNITFRVMYDLEADALIDLKPYGIHFRAFSSGNNKVEAWIFVMTFSGIKLLGGPQEALSSAKGIY